MYCGELVESDRPRRVVRPSPSGPCAEDSVHGTVVSEVTGDQHDLRDPNVGGNRCAHQVTRGPWPETRERQVAGERPWRGWAADLGGRRTDGFGESVESGDRDDDRALAQAAHDRAEHRGGGGQRRARETGECVSRFGVTEKSKRDVPVRRRHPTYAGLVGAREGTQLLEGLRRRPHGKEQSSHHPERCTIWTAIAPAMGSTMST